MTSRRRLRVSADSESPLTRDWPGVTGSHWQRLSRYYKPRPRAGPSHVTVAADGQVVSGSESSSSSSCPSGPGRASDRPPGRTQAPAGWPGAAAAGSRPGGCHWQWPSRTRPAGGAQSDSDLLVNQPEDDHRPRAGSPLNRGPPAPAGHGCHNLRPGPAGSGR